MSARRSCGRRPAGLPLAFALDWSRPPRQQNSTSFFYAHTDQWRYETLKVTEILSPTAPDGPWDGAHDRLQRARRTHGLAAIRAAARSRTRSSIAAQAAGGRPGAEGLRGQGAEVRRAASCPATIRTIRRTGRATCSSGAPTCSARRARGTNISSSICSAPTHGVLGKDLGETGRKKPQEVAWHDEAPEGKLDLLVTLDFRMSTTCVYSDIVLPTATWYEKNDLNTSDMHPFIHPLTAAVDPAWECAQRLGHLQGDRQEVLRGRAGGAGRREGRGADADHARHAGRDGAAVRRQGLEERRDRADARQDHAGRSPWSSATIPTSTSASPRSAR